MHMQRYVSQLLTHFVGRNVKQDEDRYQLLLRILKSGWLLSSAMVNTKPEDLPSRIKQPSYSYPLDISIIDLNDVFISDVVCFADIPLADLHLHMQKYSLFGISFKKDYLIKKGASPVFYISSDSIDTSEKDASLETVFRNELQNYLNFSSNYQNNLIGQYTSSEMSQYKFQMFFLKRVLCFLKFWKSSKDDLDVDNFYLEREWRVYGGLPFSLDDVERIIIPRQFSKNLRVNIPEFNNEVVFSDGGI